MVSGTISLPSLGYFSPFPRGTCSLSVAKEYLALSRGRDSFPQGSSCPVVLGNLNQKAYTFSFTGLSPSVASLSRTVQLKYKFLTFRKIRASSCLSPTTPNRQRAQALKSIRFRLFPFLSPLLRESKSF